MRQRSPLRLCPCVRLSLNLFFRSVTQWKRNVVVLSKVSLIFFKLWRPTFHCPLPTRLNYYNKPFPHEGNLHFLSSEITSFGQVFSASNFNKSFQSSFSNCQFGPSCNFLYANILLGFYSISFMYVDPLETFLHLSELVVPFFYRS
jgi:hypothetical protein